MDNDTKYEELKEALIKSNPWYIRLAYVLRGGNK